MRYNKRITFLDGPDKGLTISCNVTSQGDKSQSLIFGDVKQNRIIVRIYPKKVPRSGFFRIDDQNYRINFFRTLGLSTMLYGVEYNGRI